MSWAVICHNGNDDNVDDNISLDDRNNNCCHDNFSFRELANQGNPALEAQRFVASLGINNEARGPEFGATSALTAIENYNGFLTEHKYHRRPAG